MQDASLVGRRESSGEFARELHGFIAGQTADAAQKGAEIVSVDVLHREKRLAFGFADIVNPADVGVRDQARDADLFVKATQQVLVALGASAVTSARPIVPGRGRRRGTPRPCRGGRRSGSG